MVHVISWIPCVHPPYDNCDLTRMRKASVVPGAAAPGPEMQYLGCVPVTDIGESFTQSAVELLVMKLSRLQKKMVDKVVEKKYGTRLSEASPMYQKVAQKLANSEMDCTRGDTVNVVLDTPTESIILIETKNDQRTVISMHDILSLTLLPPRDGDHLVYFSFIQEVAQNRLQCHVLQSAPTTAEECRVRLSTAVREAATSDSRTKGVLGKASGMATDLDKNRITFGVGLHKKSSIRVSDGLRRRGTVNLKGKSGAEVKRRSSTYGNTFASFGAPAPAAAVASPSRPTLDDGLPDVDDAFLDIDDNEFDDDIFGQDDMLGDDDERGDGFDDLDLNLDQFGFDGADEEEDGDGC
eukprot:m.169511 g.169511  ORF g.169511 m.169511 type:complete len:352 (+) comp24167_c0_seq1:46-1101(+)